MQKSKIQDQCATTLMQLILPQNSEDGLKFLLVHT